MFPLLYNGHFMQQTTNHRRTIQEQKFTKNQMVRKRLEWMTSDQSSYKLSFLPVSIRLFITLFIIVVVVIGMFFFVG